MIQNQQLTQEKKQQLGHRLKESMAESQILELRAYNRSDAEGTKLSSLSPIKKPSSGAAGDERKGIMGTSTFLNFKQSQVLQLRRQDLIR